MRKAGPDRTSEVQAGDVPDGWFDRHQMHVLRASLFALFVMMVLGGIYISHEMLMLSQRANDNAQAVSLLSKNLDTSRKQLSDHGITPSAPPAKTVVEQVGGTPGAAGAPGRNGASGIPGPSGPPGSPGTDGRNGSPGGSGKNGIPGSPGATGAPGTSGLDGKSGDTGTEGAQGPPGPAGPPGQDGRNGTDGVNGTDGTDGKDGRNGTDGAPPAGWTYTDPAGVAYTCSPVSGTDQAAPHYACTPDTPAAPPAADSMLRNASSRNPSRHPEIPGMMSVAYAIVSDRKRL